jgi:hypothetical protein
MDPQSQDTDVFTRTAGAGPAAAPIHGTTAHDTHDSHETHGTHDPENRRGAGDTIRRAVRDVAGRQKQAGAEVMDATGRAIRSAADDLEEQSPAVADLIRSGAERVSSTAAALRERDVDDLLDTAGRFARERPAALFGVAVVAGLALSRFLKSSAKPPMRGDTP